MQPVPDFLCCLGPLRQAFPLPQLSDTLENEMEGEEERTTADRHCYPPTEHYGQLDDTHYRNA
jgi:hypothetical protein